MAIDFPNLPSLNEEFTVGTRTWIWDGTAWKSKSRNLAELVDAGVEEANDYTDNAIATHANVTTNVHGIANTLALATLSDLSSKQDVVANVSNIEIGYLDGVTSSIQSQLDGKASNVHTHNISDVTSLDVALGAKANATHTHIISDVANLSNTLNEKASLIHSHSISDVTNLSSELAGKASTVHTHSISDVTNLSNSLSEKANVVHTHSISDVTGLSNALSDKANVSHTHTVSDIANLTATVEELNILDGATITTAELNYLDGVTSNVQSQIDSKAASSHTHVISDIANITASVEEINILDGATVSTAELNYLDGATSNVQAQIDSKANSTHTHVVSDLTNVTVTATEINYLANVSSNIQTQINGKAATSHTHVISDVTNLSDSLDGKANATHSHLISDITNVTVTTTEINYLSGATSNVQAQIDGKLSLSGGTMTGKITLDGDPTQANHAANKAYVDSLSEGLHIHASVVAATTANINLATDLENGDTLDGVTLATGNRVLVKNQTTQSQNGIYVVQASGAAVRASDFDSPTEVDGGDFVFVNQGTINGDTGWVQVSDSIVTIGTDPIAFTQFSGAGTIQAGNNIVVNGYEISTVSNPSFANLTVTSSASFGNALVSGILLDEMDDVATSNNTTGDVLHWDGSNWVNTPVGNIPVRTSSVSATSYSFVLADNGKNVEFTSANAVAVTVPTNASVEFPVGTQITVVQVGAGQVTIQGDTGVTVNATPGSKLRAQWSVGTLVKRATNTWLLYGDLVL